MSNRTIKRLLSGLAVSVAMIGLVVAPTEAQAQGKKKKGDKTEAPKVTVRRGKGGKKVYRIETGFVIEGRIQKPNAFYFLERAQINYNWMKLKKDFLPRILDAVKRSPF